jgi:N-acetylmuramoyl-L-alanine amidase
LQSGQTLAKEALEQLETEYAQVKEALKQSKAEQESLEEQLAALEKSNQSAQKEFEQLKNDLKQANDEIAGLKEQVKEPENKIRIYIDQGHNPAPYHNSGASGNGLYEQDVTFLIGRILADLLNTDKRFEVQLSRPNKSVVLGTDNKSSLMARVEGAAAFNADYLISLHTNSYDQDTANGIEVYVAEKESESYIFGQSLLNGLIDSTKLVNRGMKLNSDLDILEFSSMPAALLEMGFISNPTDAALLGEHPDLFAQGIYNGILDYFGFLPKDPIAT